MLNGKCHCGKAGWELLGKAESATACNCTLCRRYGGLWAYGYESHGVSLHGEMSSYIRSDETEPSLEILFCPNCAGVVAWRGLRPGQDGRVRVAVNLRLSSSDAIADVPIRHFEGLNSFTALPPDGRCVRDMWF